MSPQERERDKAMNPTHYAVDDQLHQPAMQLSGVIVKTIQAARKGWEIDKSRCDSIVERAQQLLSSGKLRDQKVAAETKKLIAEMSKCEQYSQDQLKKILGGYHNFFRKSPEISHALNGR